MGDISRNISRYEVKCKCGCGIDTIDAEVVKLVQLVCDTLECRVNINSACRCSNHNKAVGGSVASQHLKGKAIDCDFVGMDTNTVYQFLNSKYPERYGLGLYKTFIHIDSRNDMARW